MLSSEKDFEARLFIGLSADGKTLVGTLDRKSIKPVRLDKAVKANETITSIGFDPDKRAIVYYNERSKQVNGSPDYITAREILSGSDISEIGGVEDLIDGGIITSVRDGSSINLTSKVPAPIENGELGSGFLSYVAAPNDGDSHLRLISPSVAGESDTILVGHPNGSVEFAVPVVSPLLVPLANLTSGGAFNGTPNVASGSWRYQLMGTTQIVSNTSGSKIEVELSVPYAMQTAGSRAGLYASLVDGGADYKKTFLEGVANVKRDGGGAGSAVSPGGVARWKVMLDPGQKCQIAFGAWVNATGTLVCTIGTTDETGGTTKQTVYQPSITIRRII